MLLRAPVFREGFTLSPELSRLNENLVVEKLPDAGDGLPFDRPDELAQVVQVFLEERG